MLGSRHCNCSQRSGSHSSSASWCSTNCTTKHPSTSSTSASLSPVSPPDSISALPAEVFSSCLAIISAVMVGGLFLWPALRYVTGYQTVWEIRPSAETPLSVHWRRFYFHLTRIHSAFELSDDALYKFTYLLILHCFNVTSLVSVNIVIPHLTVCRLKLCLYHNKSATQANSASPAIRG